jgi:DNA polymerase-3 subunit epsilon
MQLRLDAADRLVELVEERRGAVSADEAARELFALARAPVGLARALLEDVVSADARLSWNADSVGLAGASIARRPLEQATYVVFDLETTGLRPGSSGICEIGAVRLRGLVHDRTFQTLTNPGRPIQPAVSDLIGLTDRDLRSAPPVGIAVERFLRFVGDAVLVAHNARFDLSFLDREVEQLTGRRVAAQVIDTVGLARRLLEGRSPRASLAALSHFFGTSAQPCHRALPDAEATAEIFVTLAGLAQERGAASVEDLCALAASRPRRVAARRSLAFGAPQLPGVYLFRDKADQVLYVGKARDLRARLRSYFGSARQRPAVEAAIGALARIEWRVLGSELEAALEELRLIRSLRPPANARHVRPDRYAYLRRRSDGVVVTAQPSPLGPIRSRSDARLAARALRHAAAEDVDALASGAPLAPLQARMRRLARGRRFEDAARLRDGLAALERVVAELRELDRLRSQRLCVLVPAAEAGFLRAYFVAAGRIVAERIVPTGGGARLEIEAGLAIARRATLSGASLAPEDADELHLIGSFVRNPPPELRVAPLDPDAIVAACASHSAASPAVNKAARSRHSRAPD